ncbi:hypothetical protein MPDQ_006671 [Monascus purpureus]|uniref:Trafficking protein particle complex II-specific subunit 65 IgD3 domain-containing protein n=1 Tax=Monascus purpureus TaxID=5098 RepID=A0A507QY98_MONPU|nr:hypothetical protein MPDQ_006671 [Monascus purpureus]BDD54792.1 hypothetical protein MAP00_000378 [Monascus purpureus]
MPALDIPREFLRHAVIDTVIPQASNIDIEAALASALEGGADDLSAVLSSIPQRSLLFFDEFLQAHIVLRLSNCSVDALQHHIQRLEIRLDAFAIDPAESATENHPPTKDLVFSGIVDGKEEPLVVVNAFEGDEESGNHVYVIWNIETFLRRPRVRIQHPSVLFIASASLNPTERRAHQNRDDGYLPPLIPASTNVLQPLSADSALNKTEPFLPASRLLRVVPATYVEEPIDNIQQRTSNPIRIVPAASARIRYTRLKTYTGKPTTVASLDFEVSPFLNSDVILDKAELALSDGSIETLSDVPGLSPPIICRPRDDISLVYKLVPEYEPDPNPSTTVMSSTLDISLGATILLSEDCHPNISMQWRTTVDFSVILNPTFGGPSQALQRNNRPASLSMSLNQSNGVVSAPSLRRSSLRERAYSVADMGVTISFSGPAHVEVGKPFSWGIFIVNRSPIARKLAMIAIPRRKLVDPCGHATRPSTSSLMGEPVAEAVTDENIIHAKQKSVAGQDAELICLTTDIRIGPLLPGTCHSTEFKLLPLAIGALHLEAVRIVDLHTNEPTDIRDLPDILAFDGKGTGL